MQTIFTYIDSLHYLTLGGLAGAIILVLWIYDKATEDSDGYRH